MSLDTLTVDAYQLTTLVAHHDAGRTQAPVAMAFFFRKLPRNRNYVLFCGLHSILEHAAAMALDDGDLDALLDTPLLGPALEARPDLVRTLRALEGFEGEIDAMCEGTPAFAGPALRTDGKPFSVGETRIGIYTPLLQVRTDLLRAKLIETPWLGRINHMSMVASKAARVVAAARGKPVLEFGARRTHPAAAVDASYAGYLAGVTATSNVAALRRHGVPISGTMDHFFVQASEHVGEKWPQSERDSFALFFQAFPDASIMLVDTYSTEEGIRHAVEATDGRLVGLRLDSNVTPETVARARALLNELGAPHAKIIVSDGLDEHRVAALDGADGYGVGENITCSPDAPVGIGCVAKLTVNGYGKLTMKLARGSGKATLPGELQVHRFADHDLVALAGESITSGGRELLKPVWRGRAPVAPATVAQARASARA
ncbi:MAG: Nicotinate phosphoribosyltransferase, partial [Myxococcales bacterium]|nr:Nicotinate phosphoribosyltransferase [Myxococcales bacterium]